MRDLVFVVAVVLSFTSALRAGDSATVYLDIKSLDISDSIKSWMEKNELLYAQLDERTYALRFESDNHPNLIVFVSVSKSGGYVSIFSPVILLPEDVPNSFFEYLLGLNERIWQAKFAFDSEARWLYFEFEVPTRIIDEDELVADIGLVAKKVDELYPDIAEKAGLK